MRAYLHKLLVLILTGVFLGREGKATYDEGLASAHKSGDSRSKVFMLSNVGTFFLDTGAYAAAADSYAKVRSLAEGPSERATVACNLGELALRTGDVEAARRRFQAAQDISDRHARIAFVPVLAASGIGLCDLACGRLRAATKVEERVRSALEHWNRDPFLLVRFLAELDRRRGDLDAAVATVRANRPDRDRPVYWIKNLYLEAMLLGSKDRSLAEAIRRMADEEARKRKLTSMISAGGL